MSKTKKSATQARLGKEAAERGAKMAKQKAARLAAEAKKPALANQRPLSAIEADIAATQTDDTANLIRRGEYLIEAKEQIEHGDWTRWLSANFDLSERTAQSQMQVARYVAGLGKNETIAVLNLSKAVLYAMSYGDYHADYIPAILQQAGKQFLTPRGVKRVIYKYKEAHKTPEEREAERLVAQERCNLIAKANLKWVPDGDDDGSGGLKVETPDYIYKIVPKGEDDGDNKVWEPQRWWKNGINIHCPLTSWENVPLDVAIAACAKDVIEEAAQKAEAETEPASGATDESETSDTTSGAADEFETEPSPKAAPVEQLPTQADLTEAEQRLRAAAAAIADVDVEMAEQFRALAAIIKDIDIEAVTNAPAEFIRQVGAELAEAFANEVLTKLDVVTKPSLAGLDAGQIVDELLALPKHTLDAVMHDFERERAAKTVAVAPNDEVDETATPKVERK